MQILATEELPLPGALLIRFRRFTDDRGYFSETFRRSSVDEVEALAGIDFVQCNESFSRANVVRGLHFQWSPFMGKLVRTIQGRMLDLMLDVRQGSPTFGKAVAVDMPASSEGDSSQWIWVPPGFAHGNLFTEPTTIEYFCSGEYSPGCEAAISPAAPDLDWSLCDPELKAVFDRTLASTAVLSDKDRDGFTLSAWTESDDAKRFVYGEC